LQVDGVFYGSKLAAIRYLRSTRPYRQLLDIIVVRLLTYLYFSL
jgi:hypothetical protein